MYNLYVGERQLEYEAHITGGTISYEQDNISLTHRGVNLQYGSRLCESLGFMDASRKCKDEGIKVGKEPEFMVSCVSSQRPS